MSPHPTGPKPAIPRPTLPRRTVPNQTASYRTLPCPNSTYLTGPYQKNEEEYVPRRTFSLFLSYLQ